jgi:hypothetical protein
MTTNARIGYGTLLYIWNYGASPPALAKLEEMTEINPPSENTDIVDATHMESPDSTREYTTGLTDPGSMSGTMNFIPGGTNDDLIRLARSNERSTRQPTAFQIRFTNGTTYDFDGYIESFEPSAAVADKMEASFGVKVSSIIDVGVIT